MKKRTFLAGAFVGGVVSGVVALLYAPQSGEKTRRKLQYKGEKAIDKVVKKGKSVCKKSEEVLCSASELAKAKADEIVEKAKEVIKK